MKKLAVILPIVLIFFALIAGVYFWFQKVTNKIFVPPAKIAIAASSPATNIQQFLEQKLPFNILLLGYGGGNHDGTYLTDSMMVAHIDPKQQKVYLLSIPRDIWVKIPADGRSGSYSKINAAYAIGMDDANYPNKLPQYKGSAGGGHLAETVVSQVTGLPINYFVGMDFSGFTKTIDTLNGIDINVETAFDDYQYPLEGKEDDACGHSAPDIASLSAQLASPSATLTELDAFPCRFEHLHFDIGQQHMDGLTALKYVRSRHSLQDGTDFGRAARQRNLILAVKQKIFSVGFLPQIMPFIGSLSDDVRTDVGLTDISALLQNANVLNKYQISTLALTDRNYLIDTFSSDGQSILASKDGQDNWSSVHKWIADTLSGKTVPVPAIVQIENASGTPGLAQMAADRLKSGSLQVLATQMAKVNNLPQTTITVYDKNILQTELDAIKKEFKTSKITLSQSDAQTGYNVLVLVGVDYKLISNKKVVN